MLELLVGILVGLVALVGALVAVIVTSRDVKASLRQAAEVEQERWRREDARRHEEVRRQAYPVFLAVVDEGVLGISELLNRGGGFGESFAGPHWRERLREALAVIEFVGTPPTIHRAREFDRAVRRLLVGATGVIAASVPNQQPDLGVVDGAGDEMGGSDLQDAEDHAEAGDLAADSDAAESLSDVDASLQNPMSFLDPLPYPLGDDVAPDKMYGGHPWAQVFLARAELRIRRHQFVNAARVDLGMPEIDYPEQGRPMTEDETKPEGHDPAMEDADAGGGVA